MKSGAILLLIPGILFTAGCSAAMWGSAPIWGNLAVLVISIAIFFCTLSLGIPVARQSLSGFSRSESRQQTDSRDSESRTGSSGAATGRTRTRG
jgi:hypothetical protein